MCESICAFEKVEELYSYAHSRVSGEPTRGSCRVGRRKGRGRCRVTVVECCTGEGVAEGVEALEGGEVEYRGLAHGIGVFGGEPQGEAREVGGEEGGVGGRGEEGEDVLFDMVKRPEPEAKEVERDGFDNVAWVEGEALEGERERGSRHPSWPSFSKHGKVYFSGGS